MMQARWQVTFWRAGRAADIEWADVTTVDLDGGHVRRLSMVSPAP